MRALNEFLSTKVKNAKSLDHKELDIEKTQCHADIVIATFMAILSTKCYKEGSTFQKKIYKGKIDYDLIKQILEEEFNYYVHDDDIKKDGIIREVVKEHFYTIEALINYKKVVNFRANSHSEKIDISGIDLYEKYRDKIFEK